MTEQVLYLSPHLDDVVWSCPGDVMRTATAGGRAVVATIFTASDGGVGEQTRKAEDRRAVQQLGGQVRHLDLVDAPWRSPWWATDECRFGDLMCGPLNDALVSEVVESLSSLCDEMRPDRLVAPLGVGQHVDHRTVFAAAVELAAASGVRVEFYEDRPYSFVDHSVGVRLRELGLSDAEVDWPGYWSAFRSARYVEAFVSGDDELREIIEYVERLGSPPTGRRAQRIDARLTADELATAHLAMQSYGSQIDAFMDAALLARCLDERRWYLSAESPVTNSEKPPLTSQDPPGE